MTFNRQILFSIRGLMGKEKTFLSSLGKTEKWLLLTLLLIQAIAYSYFLRTIPLHYDEWFSWFFYSGKGFTETFTEYPAPNNHVLYNLVSRLFVLLCRDPEIGMRLTSLFSSLFCSYFFYRLCKLYFGPAVSLLLLGWVMVQYNFIMYSVEARGYSLTNLFCVLMMYSSVALSQNYRQKRQRIMLVLSIALGLLSVPSFLYALFPVCILLFVFLFSTQKQNLKFYFLDLFIAGALTLLLYSGILLHEGARQLIHPNSGSTAFRLSEHDAWEKIFHHLQDIVFFLFQGNISLSVCLFVTLASTAICYFTVRRPNGFTANLPAAMVISPLPILIMHQVIPFPRTWLYLLFPIALCLGFLVNTLVHFMRRIGMPHFLRTALTCLIPAATVFGLTGFLHRHRVNSAWDYELSYLQRQYIQPGIGKIKRIARTDGPLDFYPAEVIWFFCRKESAYPVDPPPVLDSIRGQDVLIINENEYPKFFRELSDYREVLHYHGIFVFIRKYLAGRAVGNNNLLSTRSALIVPRHFASPCLL
jgi:hypothetical protein